MSKQKVPAWLQSVTPLLLYSFLIVNGILGIDFGRHWDEILFREKAVYLLTTDTFFPGFYYYPSFCYYLVFAIAKIYVAVSGVADAGTLLTDDAFQAATRVVFLAITSLTVIWAYLLAQKVTKNYWAALIAGLIVCASFEFSYHSRWAVSDGIAVQFAVLSTLMLFLNTGMTKKIILSSVVAGIAAGTKYTAGIVSVTILVFLIQQISPGRDYLLRTWIPRLLLSGLFLAMGFLLTTPGAVFERHQFLNDLAEQKQVYSHGHIGYTIAPGSVHFLRTAEYVVFVLFAKAPAISALIFLLAITGAVLLLKRRAWLPFCFFGTLFIYVLYVTSYGLMIVRNLLFILPFFAVLAAVGVHAIGGRIKKDNYRFAGGSFLMLLLVVSCAHVVSASVSVKNRSAFDVTQGLQSFMRQHEDKEYLFSLRASVLLPAHQDTGISSGRNTWLVFYKDEIPHQLYDANIRNQFVTTLGMEEVNFNYYPTWAGDDRLVIMDYSKASDDILFYALKGEKSLVDHKLVCDVETVNADSSGFSATEYFNDSAVSLRIDTVFLGGVAARSSEAARSGTYSLKLDKDHPDGIHCTLPGKRGSHYYFSVWRKDAGRTGCLVVENKKMNFWKGVTHAAETDSNGWELLLFDYLITDTAFSTISINTWQPDTLTPAFFDDLTIRILEQPGK